MEGDVAEDGDAGAKGQKRAASGVLDLQGESDLTGSKLEGCVLDKLQEIILRCSRFYRLRA